MIVVDTSVWINHFRRRESILPTLIATRKILLHPYVHGELMLGGLPSIGPAAEELLELRRCPVASAAEAAAFIGWAELTGTGIGYVDAHLLLSARLLAKGQLYTSDRGLHAQALRLGVAYAP